MNKYIFIKLTDAKDLNYVYKLKFVYKDKDGSLKRVSKDKIEQHYNKLKGKYSDAQVYYMILRADEDCDRYIELHKDDKPEEPIKKEVEPTKEKFKGSKQEYIEKMIAKGYSEEDAEELAENAYGGD